MFMGEIYFPLLNSSPVERGHMVMMYWACSMS